MLANVKDHQAALSLINIYMTSMMAHVPWSVLRSPHIALNFLFSGNRTVIVARCVLLTFLYNPFPYHQGNWDIGQLIQVCPEFYNRIDRFLIVDTPSVASVASEPDEVQDDGTMHVSYET